MKHREVCNLLSNSSGKIFPRVQKIKCGIALTTSQSRQRVSWGSFYHLCKFDVFQNKKLRGKQIPYHSGSEGLTERGYTESRCDLGTPVMIRFLGQPREPECFPEKVSLPHPNHPRRPQEQVRVGATSHHPGRVLTSPGGMGFFSPKKTKLYFQDFYFSQILAA